MIRGCCCGCWTSRSSRSCPGPPRRGSSASSRSRPSALGPSFSPCAGAGSGRPHDAGRRLRAHRRHRGAHRGGGAAAVGVVGRPPRAAPHLAAGHRALPPREHGKRVARGVGVVIEQTKTLGRIVIPPDVPPGIALFYTTIDIDGRLDGDKPRKLLDFIRERFGIEAALNTCVQVPGAAVARGGGAQEWRECDSCDALIADGKTVALGIKVADCLPVTMVDPSHSVIANIHSGWRGAAQQITAATLDALERDTAFHATQARAFPRPCLRLPCLGVGGGGGAAVPP